MGDPSKVHGTHPLASANEENVHDPGTKVGPTPTGNTPGMSLYANVTGEPSRKALNFRTLFTMGGNVVDVVVSVESIRAISERFVNTAYGFFLGKRVAYPVVSNYVRNTWGKYGQVKSMLNSSTGLFSFQFSSLDSLNVMLKNGPWFIRNHPLIFKMWNLDVNLLKEDVGNVPVWVKLHGVPVTAFHEDGLSATAMKLGTPLMLDSYTSDMCLQSWGRSSYARAMIELQADVELKDTIVRIFQNRKKTVKNEQTRTRETEELNRSQRCKAKARKSQPSVKLVKLWSTEVKTKGYLKLKVKYANSEALQHNGKVKYVKSRALIDHLSIKATWLWKKAQGKVDFTLGSLRDVAQAVTSRMTAWQSLSVHT
ncbi:beta-caryophyllene synthase [Tanacetum coccineum]